MDIQAKRTTRFRVINTYPMEDCITTCEYEGTIEELCIELGKYLSDKTTRYRKMMEKWLYLYEQEHPYVHFKVWNTSTKAWELYQKRNCRTSK